MTPTALLSLGRLPKALDIARALAGAGYRVIVAEPFSLHLCRVSSAVSGSFRVTAPNVDAAQYRQEMLDIIVREGVTLVVPISEEALHLVHLAEALPAGVRFLADSSVKLQELHDKYRFVTEAGLLDLNVPATELLGSDAATRLAARSATVLKPVYSCSGTDIRYLETGSSLPAVDPGRPMLVQERLDGAHRSTLALAHQGRILANVNYRASLFSGTVAAAFERIDTPALDRWVERFVQARQFSGFIAFDFIDDGDGQPAAIECNPRLTSGVHFFEQRALARALLDPGSTTSIALRPQRKLHQFYTSLTETQASLFRPNDMKKHLAVMRSHRDVTWQRGDPWPFLLMTPLSMPIILRSIVGRTSLGEAATRDIARLTCGPEP